MPRDSHYVLQSSQRVYMARALCFIGSASFIYVFSTAHFWMCLVGVFALCSKVPAACPTTCSHVSLQDP